MIQKRFSAQKGHVILHGLGLTLLGMMMASLSIDTAIMFDGQRQLQTATDASALSAVGGLYRSNGATTQLKLSEATTRGIEVGNENISPTAMESGDYTYGFYNWQTAAFNTTPSNNRYVLTGGYNAVANVSTSANNAPMQTLFGKLLGREEMDIQAVSYAAYDDQIDAITSGLRPFAVCQNQFNAAASDGNLSNDTIRIYQSFTQRNGSTSECPTAPTGNWGFVDLSDCSSGAPGISTIRDWIANGYNGILNDGGCVSTQPGNAISSVSSELTTLMNNGTVFAIPLIDGFTGSGSNTRANVSGFVGFRITGLNMTGSASSRFITGQLTQMVCNSNFISSSSYTGATGGSGIIKVRLVRPGTSMIVVQPVNQDQN